MPNFGYFCFVWPGVLGISSGEIRSAERNDFNRVTNFYARDCFRVTESLYCPACMLKCDIFAYCKLFSKGWNTLSEG